jgi:hypothetical protein
MVSFQFSLKESGLESDGRVRRSHQEYGKQVAPRGTSFSAADTIDFPAHDRVAEAGCVRLSAVCARLDVVKQVEGRSSQLA